MAQRGHTISFVSFPVAWQGKGAYNTKAQKGQSLHNSGTQLPSCGSDLSSSCGLVAFPSHPWLGCERLLAFGCLGCRSVDHLLTLSPASGTLAGVSRRSQHQLPLLCASQSLPGVGVGGYLQIWFSALLKRDSLALP
jgi:hypothetical protein